MAISDKKGNNRFINAASREEKDLNIEQILLGIMKDEFPDDPIYSKNKIFLESPEQQARESFSDSKIKLDKNKRLIAKRNDKDVLNVSTEKDEFETYDIAKTFPTIDEDDLDDLYYSDLLHRDEEPMTEAACGDNDEVWRAKGHRMPSKINTLDYPERAPHYAPGDDVEPPTSPALVDDDELINKIIAALAATG